MPASLLWSLVLPLTVEAVTVFSRIPWAVSWLTGWPEYETWFPATVTFDEFEIEIPMLLVPVTVKFWITTQLRPLTTKPFALPVTVTAAPGAAVKTIGAP